MATDSTRDKRQTAELDHASHDLRNQLATIINTTEVLLRTSNDDALHRDLQSINQAALAAARLATIIEARQRGATDGPMGRLVSDSNAELRPESGGDISALIVEDDRLLGDMFVRWLRLEGHRARLARDGGEALTMLAEGSVDLLVVDYRLPDTDGLALLRRARPLINGAFVALVSGATPPASTEADVVLAKPVRPPVWRDLIGRARQAKHRRVAIQNGLTGASCD